MPQTNRVPGLPFLGTERNGRWVAIPQANYKDSLSSKPPEVASIYFRRIYRTLFTRALVSIRVYSVDRETREFIRSKLTSER